MTSDNSIGLAVFLVSFLAAPPAASSPVITRGSMTTSDTCGECHKDIYRMWKTSAHSHSMDDTTFLSAWREAESREGAATSKLCLRCHAPLSEVNKDWAMQKKITWEGVNCDSCHSIVSADTSGPDPRMVLDVGITKRGPIKDAVSGAHEVAYSQLHTTSLVCAGCHEFTNTEGTPIITTFSEWSQSDASKAGRTCQNCHMGRTRADVVDPRVARVGKVEVNLHDVPGGHSLDQLHKALRLSIDPRREADALIVKVDLTNKGAGHAVPTGMPGRRVILGVQVETSDGKSYEEKKIYTRTFKDSTGELITRDSRYFSKGVTFISDTRIQSDERRSETFRFPVAGPATVYLTVTLNYEHTPTGDAEGRTWLTFDSESRTILPRAPAGK